MKFIIGSASQRKIDTAHKVITQILGHSKFELDGFAAKSLVPDTPWDRETFDGARNRALGSQKHARADYYIGLESGLIERYGSVYEEAWCCIINGDRERYGYSSGLSVPEYIIERMEKQGMEHSDIMTEIEHEFGLTENDTWGTYSGQMILREISLEEAVRNALIQDFAPEHSFYHL